jgi:phage terminase Nu1 subunit (DNA packaging protein)
MTAEERIPQHELVNQTELAKILDIAPQTLVKLVAKGFISVAGSHGNRKLFDPEIAKQEFANLTHKSKPIDEKESDMSGLPSTADSIRRFNHFKALREEANFKLTQLDLDTQSKKFIPAETVKKQLYAAGNSMRVAIESIPIRYGHLLAGGLLDLAIKKGQSLTESDVVDLVNRVIKSECSLILRDLQNELAKI